MLSEKRFYKEIANTNKKINTILTLTRIDALELSDYWYADAKLIADHMHLIKDGTNNRFIWRYDGLATELLCEWTTIRITMRDLRILSTLHLPTCTIRICLGRLEDEEKAQSVMDNVVSEQTYLAQLMSAIDRYDEYVMKKQERETYNASAPLLLKRI